MPLAALNIEAATGIATVTINRPEVLNAIDVATAHAIRDAVAPVAGVPGLRCVVLKGAGRAFVAGGDLRRFAEDFEAAASVVDELLDALHPVITLLNSLQVPVLASVHGAVAGAGLSIMAACDLILAADDVRFLLAYDRIGAAPDCGGTFFLGRRIGYGRAMQLMLMSETWDAATALQTGLINRVVPAASLSDETNALASQLASGPTKAFAAYKKLARDGQQNTLAEHLEQERAAFKAATRTADFREGVSAFLAKRVPHFRGV
jgi:2-(1,2-epoxy-1,2-dihydrophenyl)acetyl-CoA isomerase